MTFTNPEILSPGGDFNSIIHGFESGADAVYTGLKSFSARKGAKNLTLEELRKVKQYVVSKNKKVYIAINTLIEDHEIPEVISLLQELEAIKVDGVIIQDLGLAKIIRENFNLEIHASTQLAVHNIHGVRALKKLGFTRTVLSRELSIKEIEKIKKAEPNMELEIFIHGALCYGFSGLCLASGVTLGRSANRGECGQICRTWFNNGEKKEFTYSLNDLNSGEYILKLRDIGVESFKIEGRMKGPSYCGNIVSYYKSILNGKRVNNNISKLEFNRSGNSGYLLGNIGGTSVNRHYSGHTGVLLGDITSISKKSFTITSCEKLENHDGLMVLPKSIGGKPFKIGVKIIQNKGSSYTLGGSIPKGYKSKIYKISNHNKALKEYKPESFKKYKSQIDLLISIKKDYINLKTESINYNFPIEIEEAKSESRYREEMKRILSPGGTSNYTFKIKSIKSDIPNPFIPSSLLKTLRNNFLVEFIEAENQKKELEKSNILDFNFSITERAYSPVPGEIPFFPYSNDKGRISLNPVVFDSDSYLKELKYFLEVNNIEAIGLNNLCHIEYISELPKIDYYCDYGLYATNKWAKALLNSLIPGLNWVTTWIEKDKNKLTPPIFISRTCFHKGGGSCPPNCKKNYNYSISQNSRDYRVVVKDCITYTFA